MANTMVNSEKRSSTQDAAISAAIDVLHRVQGFNFRGTRKFAPDRQNSNTKDIDSIVFAANRGLAIEHSTIQRYDGQLEYIETSERFVAQVNAALSPSLPRDRWFSVIIPPHLIVGKRKKELGRLQAFLTSSIVANLDAIPQESWLNLDYQGDCISFECGTFPGLELGRLYRSQGGVSGHPDEIAGPLLRELFRLKVPKLTQYRRFGFRTLLVLEDVGGTMGRMSAFREFGIVLTLAAQFFLDFIVIVVPNAGEMIVARVWKRGHRWYREVPLEMRFTLSELEHVEVPEIDPNVAAHEYTMIRRVSRRWNKKSRR